MHVVDLLDPLRGGVMRRVGCPRHVIDEEGFFGIDFVQHLDVLNGVVGHGRD